MHPDELLFNYDYHLPSDLIAQHPLAERSASRLMVLRRRTGAIEHRRFHELPDLLRPNDLLVLNETRVIPARLHGVRTRTGGRWEGLFLGASADGCWRIMGQTRGTLQPNEELTLHPIHVRSPGDEKAEYRLRLIAREPQGIWRAQPATNEPPLDVLARFGTAPLPPYIARDLASAEDFERYQTVFAGTPGAVAAPTAGLHFTPELLDRCRDRGVAVTMVTLHVGIGTFRPISAERLADHSMHAEWCEVPAAAAAAIANARAAAGRVVAIGTTTVRALESVAARQGGEIVPWSGETDLFIRPPYRFQVVDAIVTNFHLPRSSLLVMLSAFAGRELMLNAYAQAVHERYRFFSYGDAMLVE